MLLLLMPRLAAEESSAVSSTRRATESLHLLRKGPKKGEKGSSEGQEVGSIGCGP